MLEHETVKLSNPDGSCAVFKVTKQDAAGNITVEPDPIEGTLPDDPWEEKQAKQSAHDLSSVKTGDMIVVYWSVPWKRMTRAALAQVTKTSKTLIYFRSFGSDLRASRKTGRVLQYEGDHHIERYQPNRHNDDIVRTREHVQWVKYRDLITEIVRKRIPSGVLREVYETLSAKLCPEQPEDSWSALAGKSRGDA